MCKVRTLSKVRTRFDVIRGGLRGLVVFQIQVYWNTPNLGFMRAHNKQLSATSFTRFWNASSVTLLAHCANKRVVDE